MENVRLKVLRSIGYIVEPTCGVCTYGRFKFGSDFGTCDRYSVPIEGDGGDQESVRHHVFGPGERGAMRHDSLMIYKKGRCLDGFTGGPTIPQPWDDLCRAGKVHQHCTACREARPHEHITDASAVYVLRCAIGRTSEVVDVCLRLETAQGIAEGREGGKLTWTHSDSHGTYWVAQSMGSKYVVDQIDVGEHLRWGTP